MTVRNLFPLPQPSGGARRFLAAFCLTLIGFAAPAQAHFFAQPYTLPVPFAMYAWGAAAALVLSFVVVGVFAGVPALRSFTRPDSDGGIVPYILVKAGRVGSVAALLVCMITGWAGTQIALENLSMTLFWIVFVLFVPYSCALIGNYYAAVNPWRVLVAGVESATRKPFTGVRAYPPRLGYWPALAFYIAFIWIELFGELHPRGLANALLIYTALNVAGAWMFGTGTWFRYGEFFGVFLRLIGAMAPVAWHVQDRSAQTRVSLRAPFSELIALKAESLALAVFILFMLASTAYDGLHATEPWVTWFWRYLYPPVAPLLDATTAGQLAAGARLYHGWQGTMLLVSPIVYLAIFWLCIALARRLSHAQQDMRDLILWFAPSLIPIAFVYHVTHYYTIMLLQGSQIVRLLSDPLGRGWDLLGVGTSRSAGFMLEVDFIWHSQVAFILLGHIVSVYLAHVTALRLFGGPRTAAASQAPMLVLMVMFTTFGLWILSLPLTAGG